MTTVTLYGAGGTGINLISHFIEHQAKREGIAEIKAYGIDTSHSNIRGKEHLFNESNFYHLDGLDGSGKKRDTNVREISDSVKDILLQFKPSDFNIVIFSASGGSGSVINPLLVKELLNQKLKTIAIVVGTSESRIVSLNTLKTIKSLQAISQQTKQPLIVSYQDNSIQGRLAVNRAVKSIVTTLAFLASGELNELDSEDLYNWLYYPRVTDLQPSVALLDIFTQAEDVTTHPISVASIYPNDENIQTLPSLVEYHCQGFSPLLGKNVDVGQGLEELHFAISTEQLDQLMANLAERVEKYEEQSQARQRRDVILSKDDEVDDSGLVL